MKFRNFLILILFSIAGAALSIFAVGCSSTENIYDVDTWDGAVVTFVLEGGEYKNSKNDVVYYYSLREGETVRIGTPTDYSKKSISRPDYTLDEWCAVKTEEAEDSNGKKIYSYSEPWDFENDVLEYGDRITLYAHWNRIIKYSYNVCYKDADGETVILGTYEVDEGATLYDYYDYYKAIQKYPHNKTAIPYSKGNYYFDENDEPWDPDFEHPGGDVDTAINVYLHYIEGSYKLVFDADDLDSVNANTNVYLMNDIDYEGKTLRGLNNYQGIFLGNGHTIKNFNLNRGSGSNSSYGSSDVIHDGLIYDGGIVCVSIFGNAVGAEVKDVNFENVTVDVRALFSQIDKVIVAPLFVRMSSSQAIGNLAARPTTATNVSFSGTVTISALRESTDDRVGLTEDDVIIVGDRGYYVKDEASSIGDGCTFSFVKAE